MLAVSVTLRVAPSEQEKFLSIARTLIEASRLEKSVVAYSFAIDVIENDLIRVFELYTNRDALEAHMATDHFRLWRSQTGSYERVERHILNTA